LAVRSIKLRLRIHHRTRATIWANTHISHARVDSMRRDESLGLGRNWREDTLLLEALAVGTTSFRVLIKSRATNLTSSAVSACNCRSLSGCGLAESHMLWTSSTIILLVRSVVSVGSWWRSVRILLVRPWVGSVSVLLGVLGVVGRD
jgi:hypothetical protein